MLTADLNTLTYLINEHPLIREQGGIFKKVLNRTDPNKRAGLDIFFKSAKRAKPNKKADPNK